MLIVLMVFGCMGMQLFGSKFKFEEDGEYPPRENFDNFLMSFLALFQVIQLALACARV